MAVSPLRQPSFMAICSHESKMKERSGADLLADICFFCADFYERPLF